MARPVAGLFFCPLGLRSGKLIVFRNALMNRLSRHLLLLLANAALLGLGAVALTYPQMWERVSVASAWICTAFMGAALLMGPLRRAAGQRAPHNIYLRRDFGIWAALQGFLHFYAATVVSMNQTYLQTYVHVDLPPLSLETRDQMFSWGSSLGFAASLVLLLLFILSSDWSLRWLSAQRWKKLQKGAHLALWLTVLHGLVFQLLEARYAAFALLASITLLIFGLQYRGRRRA